MKLGGNFTKKLVKDMSETVAEPVEEGAIKGYETGVENANKKIQKSNKTVQAKLGVEVSVEEEKKTFDKILVSTKKIASDIKEELTEESDATIRKLDKDMGVLQKKLDKAGALATQLEKEAKEVDKIDTLVKSSTAYKSKNIVVKTNRKGKPITQEDIWKQDKERIEKSRKLTNEQKEDLKDLSIHQKQLNTLKENALNTIDEINKKEEKTEEDIIKQYKAAVNLKKVLEEMEQTKAEISKIIGKDKYDETSKITVPKSIIPNKENVSAKDAVEKYIEGYELESKLKQVYNRDLKQKEAEKTKYLEDKAIKEDTKQYEKAEKNQKKVVKKLEETNKELANKAKEFDEQFKKLEQDTITSVMEYIKVADKTTEKSSDSMKKAFKDLATYINSGGDLNNINEGLEKLLQADSNLVNKNSDLFKERIKELQDILAGKKSLQDVADYHLNQGDLLFKIDTDEQTDTNLENLKKEQKELEKTKKIYEENIEARKKALNSNATDEIADVPSSRIQGDIPVSVVPEVEPEEFVGKITEQLKGHPVKVDVELNSENIAEEVKKITEMIPDKKEIEISVNLEDIDKKIIENVSVNNTSDTSTSEIKRQNEIQKELEETDEQVQKLMFHYGLLNQSRDSKKSHQFGDEITAYAEGKRNGNRGWADGTGTYVTNDATEYPVYMPNRGEFEKFFAFDVSKLKLYEAHTEEEAKKFYEFQHKLEQFVLALGSGFSGFDDNIDDVDSESLYKEAKSVFSKYPEIFNKVFKDFEEFDAFIDEMINLTSLSGMNEDGSKNLDKFMNFKKEYGIDDIKTRFLKKLGFQGTDLSGTSYGGIQSGSVIFDFEEAPIVAKGKRMSEVLEQIGISAEETKYKVEQVVKAEKDLGNVKSNKSALESETNTNKTENKPDTTKKNNGLQITVDVVPEFNPDEFIQDITSKLKGKEVPIDVAPSENSEKFLDRISAYSEKMNILSKEDIEQLVNKQDIPLNVTPKLETPENFAKEVTNQLKGTSAKIDVKPQITDKAISDLLKEQTKSKSVSVSAPKLNAKNLIEEFNLQGKDIDSNITSKVRDLSKEINKLSKEAIETNSDKSWEGLVSHIKELANILNSYGKIRLDTSQFESVLKIAEQLKDSRIFIGDNVKNDVLSGASADNLRQLNNEFINLGVTFTSTRDKAMNLDDVWDEFVQSTGRVDLADITTGAERISKIIEELREAKNVLYGDKSLISADKYGTSEMLSYIEQVEKKQKEYAKVNPDKAKEYQRNIDFIRKEISAMKGLDSVVNQITTSVDKKTNAFREEEQVVTRTVQREISELERLSGELFSIRQDIENISSTITTLPKIDFDVDLSTLNIENIDNAAIASFNTFREQLAGLEAQLNVSNLSEKLLHISEAFEKLSKVDNLENLNTKNLETTPITNLAEKAGSITELVEALNKLKECLDGLKTTSFDKEQFDGLKLTKANVNNMADMAVALETIGIALQSFDKDANESLSSINELLGKSEDLKNLSSIVKKPTRTKEVKKEVDNEPTASAVNKSNNISDNISNGTYKKSVDEVTARFSKLNKEVKYNKDLVKKLDTAYGELILADGVENKIQAYREFEKALASARNELSGLEKKSEGLNLSEKLNNQFNEIKVQYSGVSYLSSSLNKLEDDITAIQEKAKVAGADLTKLAQDARQAFATFSKGVLPSGDVVGSFNNLDEAIEKAKSMVNEYGKVKTELKTPLQVNDNGIAKMTAQVVDLNGELKTLTFVYNDATKAMVKQTTNIRKELSGIPGVVDAVKNKLKDMAVYWTATTFDPYDIINGFRKIYDVVKELDDQFVEMQKVSDESVASLKEYQNLSFDKADEVGTTASQLESSTADFLRIGESLDKAAESAKTANTLLNVSEFDSIDAATESLTAMSQAYSELEKIDIVNKLNLAGNNFSISTAGLAEALQKSAAALKTQGNDINEAISLIVAGNAVGQDPDSTGAGMRTISLRIAGTEEAKDELASLGEDIDDFVVQTQSKTDKIIRDYTAVATNDFKGVSVLDENGNLRNTFEILLDISKVYKEILETDKKAGTNRGQALIEELAGKNRANIAASILMNGDILEDVYNQVQKADGSAQQELDKYLDSISGKATQLENQLQKLASVTVDSSSFKTLLDITNGLLDTITSIVEEFGSVEMILGGLGAFFAQKKGLDQFKNCIIY